MAAIKALEQWCKVQCDGYRDVAITNMTTSFKNGLAFCALIHKYRPDLIDYDSLKEEDVFENNRLVAEEKLGIPALLDAEDMVALRVPDRLSILTYVSQYHNYFKGRPPMGGVKRPAEGSKEEPSEKKNLPVVAKTFVPKTAIENRLPSTLAAQTSPKLARAAVQKEVLAENSNKNGTLNSKCAACKSHVHLVQRHFVDGKLYHRSCFKCSECSSLLHSGGYKPGKNTDTFICNAHQDSCKSSSEAGIKNGTVSSAGWLNTTSQTHPASRPSSSVLSAPLNIVLKPVCPTLPSQSWTASAHKTQTARQRFFQAAAPVTEASTGIRKPTEPSSVLGRPKAPLSPDDEKSRVRTTTVKILAEENRNNNNKHLFTIRSAERRFGDKPSSADSPSLRKDKCSQGPAGNWAGQPSTSQTNNKEPPYQVWGQLKLKPVKIEQGLKHAEAFTEQHKPGSMSATSSNVPSSITRSPMAPTPAVPPVTFALFDPEHFRVVSPLKPQLGSGNLGAKKGKYLSPPNASRTEMRSPSVKSYHIPVEQIERDLNDIETNVAQLEKEGVELEKKLRSCEEEGKGDVLMDPLMVDWFNLIRKKQMYIRKESELVYIAKTQELEQQQPGVEGELRRLLEKPDHLKSREEQQREKKLMQRLMEIVDGRNAIVEGLDEDRLREVEEDQQLNEMMQNLDLTALF
ncbi:hypothetical protein FQN60_003997 [Etheostoma spectabile]|uniref:MICAL-like protein 2 n=1 Tax=Etheostoma spectabile TaxID=54343 RepID=A0A5J5CWQ2_9PERO|nr:hypothetical protein FQN60_003997 [Etheostoma spectabile]